MREKKMGDISINLPPGFRFDPTDEELVLHFLYPKAFFVPCHPNIIPDLDDLHRLHDPSSLQEKALLSGNKYYFFSRLIKNRAMENGFWKELNLEEPIFSGCDGEAKQVGVKKFLIFCSPNGRETSWVMEEYDLCHGGPCSPYEKRRNVKLDCDQWVLCRVQESKGIDPQSFCNNNDNDDDETDKLSCMDEMFLALDDDEENDNDDDDDDLEDISLPNYNI